MRSGRERLKVVSANVAVHAPSAVFDSCCHDLEKSRDVVATSFGISSLHPCSGTAHSRRMYVYCKHDGPACVLLRSQRFTLSDIDEAPSRAPVLFVEHANVGSAYNCVRSLHVAINASEASRCVVRRQRPH